MAERLIKGQVINAQNAESIYVLKNDNQKLKDRLAEMQLENEKAIELGRKQLNDQTINSNEMGELQAKIEMLNEVNLNLQCL